MKKLLAFLVLALGLVACGQKEEAAPAAAEQPAVEQAAEAVEQAAEEVKEEATEAAEEVKEATEKVAEEVKTEAKN